MVLHKETEWESIEHWFGPTARGPTDEGTLTYFVWVARNLHGGKVFLTKGLGIDTYPYALKVKQNSLPPPEKMSVVGTATYADLMAQAS